MLILAVFSIFPSEFIKIKKESARRLLLFLSAEIVLDTFFENICELLP
jgi:hypothetical protein